MANADVRNFLFETAVDGMIRVNRFQGNGSIIQQIGAFADEDAAATELTILVDGIRNAFDRHYLARIWPKLLKLPIAINVNYPQTVDIEFPGRAIVVLLGVTNYGRSR